MSSSPGRLSGKDHQRMRFSERMGYKPVADIIQVEGMNDELRNSLWNVLYVEKFSTHEFNNYGPSSPHTIERFSISLWSHFFKLPVDEMPDSDHLIHQVIRKHFFACKWHEVYDFIEFCLEFFEYDYDAEGFVIKLNAVLERELAGYRIINGRIAPITSPQELASVQSAIDDNAYPGASAHLKTALELLSSKTNPDYRNSIKESMSAVESVCRVITGDSSATLGAALAKIAKSQPLHGALTEGFKKLYGYTSDGGIRHAMREEPNLTQADAIYFLVSCSAFVNYLKSKLP